MDQEEFEFYGELQGETPKAWFVYDGINTITIPKSQAKVRLIDQSKCDAALTIPMWLAKQKGIV